MGKAVVLQRFVSVKIWLRNVFLLLDFNEMTPMT
jgi:hypothetical protein